MLLSPGLKTCFMGGNQAGVVGIMAILSSGSKIEAAVSYSPETDRIIHLFGIPAFRSVKSSAFRKFLKISDLLVSVHGREIVGKEILVLPRFGGINVHPYLYKYKGSNPVGEAFSDGNFNASVGVHVMEEKVDSGKVIVEEFVDISGASTPEEGYNRLYPYYASALLAALMNINKRKNGKKKAV
jgi:methionyl-tRNA formyltransferase